jgi:hypothetical protein
MSIQRACFSFIVAAAVTSVIAVNPSTTCADIADATNFPNTAGILASEGMNLGHQTFQTTITVPAGMTDIKFTLLEDLGDYLFSFGVYFVATNPAPAATAAYGGPAIDGLDAALVFDEHTQFNTPGDMTTVTGVSPGDVLGLFLIPNDSRANFVANPANYYDEIGYPETLLQIAQGPAVAPVFWSPLHQPMFLDDDANYDNMDQFLTFDDGSKIVVFMEDLSRSPDFANQEIITGSPGAPPVIAPIPGEIDFDDLAVRIEFVPEPGSLAILALGGLALVSRRR